MLLGRWTPALVALLTLHRGRTESDKLQPTNCCSRDGANDGGRRRRPARWASVTLSDASSASPQEPHAAVGQEGPCRGPARADPNAAASSARALGRTQPGHGAPEDRGGCSNDDRRAVRGPGVYDENDAITGSCTPAWTTKRWPRSGGRSKGTVFWATSSGQWAVPAPGPLDWPTPSEPRRPARHGAASAILRSEQLSSTAKPLASRLGISDSTPS